MSFTTMMTMVGMAVAVIGGAAWTAAAVLAGEPMDSFVRFTLAVVLGLFYFYLYHLSRGRRFFQPPMGG